MEKKGKKNVLQSQTLDLFPLKIVDIFVLQHSLTDQTQPGQLCEEE